ncbi:hypothetical protein HD806DRAFT_514294 [Xylariaceae sp. AK1471]|nr:hypothetical protein HD806DRAFT_514294 [Xylariaceae sp. AK1471]
MVDTESLQAYRHRLDGAAATTLIIVTTAVSCKIWCKQRVGGLRSVSLDDVLSVITLLLAHIYFGISICELRPVLGRHAVDVTASENATYQRFFFTASLLYIVTIGFVKFTVLAFYWRLFSIKARIPIAIVAFLAFSWLVSYFFIALFVCIPIRASFDPSITNAKCGTVPPILYMGESLINVILDFILVFMPLPYIWRLNTSLAQRIVFGGIFALGIFTSVVSIIRLIIFYGVPPNDQDRTYSLRDIILWSIVEINIGLTCACLPSMRPLLRLLSPARSRLAPRSARKNPESSSLEQPPSKGSARSHPRSPLSALFSDIVNTKTTDSQEDILLTGDHFIAKTSTNITATSTAQVTNVKEPNEASR